MSLKSTPAPANTSSGPTSKYLHSRAESAMIEAYRVSTLARFIKDLLESNLALTNLWVEGEVSNLSRPSSGHTYFTLKDADAQIRCVMFRRASPIAEIGLAPTPVQGFRAAAGIVGAIKQLNAVAAIDVIIIARGGGSTEELWPFNEEVVARAVYGSAAPVISAVGHETDFT